MSKFILFAALTCCVVLASGYHPGIADQRIDAVVGAAEKVKDRITGKEAREMRDAYMEEMAYLETEISELEAELRHYRPRRPFN